MREEVRTELRLRDLEANDEVGGASFLVELNSPDA